MTVGLEVKADLPGPLPQLCILPSHYAVQLVRPGPTICHKAANTEKEESCWTAESNALRETGTNDQMGVGGHRE